MDFISTASNALMLSSASLDGSVVCLLLVQVVLIGILIGVVLMKGFFSW